METAADGVRRRGQVDADRERRRPAVVPHRRRLAVVVHQVVFAVHVGPARELGQDPRGRHVRERQRVRLRLEERGVEQAPGIVEIVLPLETAAVLEQRPPPHAGTEVPAGVERLVVPFHGVAVAVAVVAAQARVVLEREPQPIRAAVKAGEAVVGAAVAAVVVAGAAADPEAARAERGLERLGLDGAEGAGPPGQGVRPPHHAQRLQRVRADVAQGRVHAGGARRERAGPVDEDADLLGVEPADRRVEVDRPAAERGHPRVAAERLREVLGDATLDLRRGRGQLRRHLGHEGGDAHLLGERPDLQNDGEVHPARTGRDRPLTGREPEQARDEPVIAGRHAVELEPARPVGDRRRHDACVVAGIMEAHETCGRAKHDGGAGKRQPLRVRHRARHLRVFLGGRARRGRERREQARPHDGPGANSPARDETIPRHLPKPSPLHQAGASNGWKPGRRQPGRKRKTVDLNGAEPCGKVRLSVEAGRGDPGRSRRSDGRHPADRWRPARRTARTNRA